MTSVPQPADMTAVYQGIWDAWNRLVGLYDGATLVQGNSYDGLNRRTNIILPDETRDDYYTADWRLIQEDSTLPATTIFYWGLRYIDELIARFDLRSSAFIYSLPDANWNVVAIADPTADDGTGAIVERYAYTPYGVVLFLDAGFVPLSGNISAYGWETLYAGYRYDTHVGLYLARNRELLPAIGSWLSRDPSGLTSDVNFLRFTNNSPIINVDSSGLRISGPCGLDEVFEANGIRDFSVKTRQDFQATPPRGMYIFYLPDTQRPAHAARDLTKEILLDMLMSGHRMFTFMSKAALVRHIKVRRQIVAAAISAIFYWGRQAMEQPNDLAGMGSSQQRRGPAPVSIAALAATSEHG